MMDVLQAAALLAATMTIGIGAGVFQLYNFAIMPGLGRTDDRTFVGAFQQIDTAIIGPKKLSPYPSLRSRHSRMRWVWPC